MKYPKIEAIDKEGYSDWIFPSKKIYKLGCCDCGLVHDIQFNAQGKKVSFKIRRNNRATGQIRRHLFKRK